MLGQVKQEVVDERPLRGDVLGSIQPQPIAVGPVIRLLGCHLFDIDVGVRRSTDELADRQLCPAIGKVQAYFECTTAVGTHHPSKNDYERATRRVSMSGR
jgi:hypothetical protein